MVTGRGGSWLGCDTINGSIEVVNVVEGPVVVAAAQVEEEDEDEEEQEESEATTDSADEVGDTLDNDV